MKNHLTLLTTKIIIVILIIVIFFFIMKHFTIYDNNIDQFTNFNDEVEYKPSNTRISYSNIGIYPWDRHSISSSIPYDVTLKKEFEKSYYYEFDNETYNKKLKELYQSKREDVIIADGSAWSKWLNPKILPKKQQDKLLKYYEFIFDEFEKKLNSGALDLPGNDKKYNIQVVHDLTKRYKINKNDSSYCLFEIEMILYREGKLQGKHIKLLAISNAKTAFIIDIRIVGVISEDNIVLYPYVANDTTNNNNFDIFVPETRINKYTKELHDGETMLDDESVNKALDDILYKKIINDYNYEDEDMSS